jgi:hypothetical protein
VRSPRNQAKDNMNKYAADIEKSMAFLLSGDLKKSLGADEAVAHLVKARNLLENVGLSVHSKVVEDIIKKAQEIDESDIEVQG